MKNEFADLVKYRIEKSKSTLDDAKKCFSQISLAATVNRIYYAIFYSVNALLISKGLASSKHSGVKSLFNREFVKTGIIDQRLNDFYSSMLDHRQESDYRDFIEFERSEVEHWLKLADEFVRNVENVLKNTNE